jgi:hypothetical protein
MKRALYGALALLFCAAPLFAQLTADQLIEGLQSLEAQRQASAAEAQAKATQLAAEQAQNAALAAQLAAAQAEIAALKTPPPPPPPPVNPNAAVLSIGSGWTSAPVAPVGTGPTVIARWDMIPDRNVTGVVNVGVLAFHIDGIDRVELACNGGQAVTVKASKLNPQSGVVEWWAVLPVTSLPAGSALEIRAIAYPSGQNGTGRLLPPLTLYVGGDVPTVTLVPGTGALSGAAKSLEATGGTILMPAGSYELGAEAGAVLNKRWIKLQPAPGVAASDVVITGSVSQAGIRVSKLHLKGLSVNAGPTTIQVLRSSGGALWVDSCTLTGAGRPLSALIPLNGATYAQRWFTGWSSVYATDSIAQDCADGFIGCALVRGCTVRRIVSDGFQNSLAVINCTLSDVNKTGTTAHPDVWQVTDAASLENVILYGNTATDSILGQGIFIKPTSLTNAAIVNNRITVTPNSWLFYATKADHLLIAGNVFSGGLENIVGPKWLAGPFANVVIESPKVQWGGAVAAGKPFPAPPAGVVYR